MPPALAARFTQGELAVLRIVADEVRRTGSCARTVAELAARAGVCVSTTRNAIRTAARLGLVTVEERRQHCARNLPNVIRIVSAAWTTWLAKGGGFKNLKPTDKEILNREKRGSWDSSRSVRIVGEIHARAEEATLRGGHRSG